MINGNNGDNHAVVVLTGLEIKTRDRSKNTVDYETRPSKRGLKTNLRLSPMLSTTTLDYTQMKTVTVVMYIILIFSIFCK